MSQNVTKKQNPEERTRIDLRRNRVIELRIKGMTEESIANALKVSRRTVIRDIQAARDGFIQNVDEMIKSFDIKGFWAERLLSLELRQKELWAALAEGRLDRSAVVKSMVILDREIERVLTSVGIKLTATNPNDVEDKTLRIIWQMPDRHLPTPTRDE